MKQSLCWFWRITLQFCWHPLLACLKVEGMESVAHHLRDTYYTIPRTMAFRVTAK